MPRSRRLFFAAVLAATGASAVASAQTVTPTAISFPTRLVGGQNLGYATRAQNLNPYGISYADCTADMTLQFSVSLAGFEGTDASVEVWASTTSDCVNSSDRGIGAPSAVCWGVSPSLVEPNASGSTQFSVRVQDLVGWQSSPPPPAQAGKPPSQGVGACAAQPTFAAVPMVINFLAVNGEGRAIGTSYQYSISTDMVGPPAPAGLCETAGETLLNLTFTPNTDSDTIGYDLYVDPIPSQVPETQGSSDSGLAPDSGNCAINASCNDSVLTGAVLPDAGSTTEETGVASGDADVLSGNGGVSSIPDGYLFDLSSGLTISDKSTAQYVITGLVDYVDYTAVISAVDGTGNIGPPSSEVCDYPEPVQDFWQNYEKDGGGQGGYCALETVGVGGTSMIGAGCALVAVAATRRRRKRRT